MKIKLDCGDKYYLKPDGMEIVETINGEEIHGVLRIETPNFDESAVRNEHYYGQIDYYIEIPDEQETGINVDDFMQYLLQHMTAEQALRKLLVGHLVEYQHLRFTAKGEEVHPLMLVTMCAMEMGWNLALQNGGDDDEVQGLAIGTDDYLNKLFGTTEIEN